MSCFFCDDNHRAYLVAAANKFWHDRQKITSADSFAEALYRVNARAMVHRYGTKVAKEDGFIIDPDQPIPPLDLSGWANHTFDPAQLCIAVDCFSGQCAGLPDWEETEEYKALQQLVLECVRASDGYKSAVWGVPELAS